MSIDILNEECQINGCVPIFGLIPNSNFWEPNVLLPKYKRSIEDYLSEKGYIYIDFSEPLKKLENNTAYAPKGTHLSPKGYKIVSNEILKKINQIKKIYEK